MKKSYTAYFYTDAEYASTEIDADTPGLALAAARRIKDEDGAALQFDKYDEAQPVNHIEILDDKDLNEVAHWRDADLLLRMAATDLVEALEFCKMTLADLEASKRKGYIAEAKKLARAALAKARPPTTAVWPYL
jgi:hypothetical protein